MTSPGTGPQLPISTNLGLWRFQDALAAGTGENYDLRGALNNPWLRFSTPPLDTEFVVYRALNITFFSAANNTGAVDSWNTVFKGIDAIIGAVGQGIQGEMNWHVQYNDATQIANYAKWLYTTKVELLKWADSLASTDAAFKGKAAYLIQAKLAQKAADFGDLANQMEMYGTKSSWFVTALAGQSLLTFGQGMFNAWDIYKKQRPNLDELIREEAGKVYEYLSSVKLIAGEPGYLGNWDPYTYWHERGGSENYNPNNPNFTETKIRELLANFSSTTSDGQKVTGDLCKPEVWDLMNARVTTRLSAGLDALDAAARELLDPLMKQYQETTNTVQSLKLPVDSTIIFTPDPVPENKNNNSSKDSNSNDPPPNAATAGGPGIDSNQKSGNDTHAGGTNGDIDNSTGGGKLDDPGHSLNLDSGGGGAGLGPGSGLSAAAIAAGLGVGLGAGAGSTKSGELTGLDHNGLGIGTGFDAGLRRGAPGVGSSIGRDLVEKQMVVPRDVLPPTGGAGELNSGTLRSGNSGMPFFPGSSGGNSIGREPQERERSAWLAENEDVWGALDRIGPRVIGRHEPDPDEASEVVLLPGGVLLPISARAGRREGRPRSDRRQRRILARVSKAKGAPADGTTTTDQLPAATPAAAGVPASTVAREASAGETSVSTEEVAS